MRAECRAAPVHSSLRTATRKRRATFRTARVVWTAQVVSTPYSSGPNKIAREITGRDYISFSAVDAYRRCPLRYYSSHIMGLPPESLPSGLLLGGAIHSAIEHHCRRTVEQAAPPSIDELVAVHERTCKNEATVPVRFGKGESARR